MDSDEKHSLELRKLALQIADLERPWWKRPAYILAALPTLLAIVALSVAFFNGFFSAQLTKLENQRHDLEAQVTEFEEKKSVIINEIRTMQKEEEGRRRSQEDFEKTMQSKLKELLETKCPK